MGEDCGLCELKRTVVAISRFQKKSTVTLSLLFSLCNEASGQRVSGEATIYFDLINPGFEIPPRIYPKTSAQPLALFHSRVQVSLVRDFIRKCSEGHAVCRERPLQSAEGLRLIDCQTRRIVAAPEDAEYFTLSYTWGKSYTPPDYTQQLSTTLPATITDAISITARLGRRYLWIDRYCIDQSSPEDLFQQCEQMDRIYANSELTIVAAAGDGPHYRLPGVGMRPRHSCLEVLLNGNTTLQFAVPGSGLVHYSVWKTRGWTY